MFAPSKYFPLGIFGNNNSINSETFFITIAILLGLDIKNNCL